jgi:hypothetical protein
MRDDQLSTGVYIMPAWAGGWDHTFGEPHSLTKQANSTMRSVARLTASYGGQAFGEIGRALANGVGANAEYTVAQVQARQHNNMDMGGKIPIVPYAIVPLHATTILEKEAFQAQMTPYFMPMPNPATPTVATSGYPVEKSGNSGGGILGTVNK